MNATGSNNSVDADDRDNAIPAKTNPHGNSGRLQSVIGKQSSCVRKMSTMPEEEDASDEVNPESTSPGHRHYQQQHHHDADSDTPSEERGRLLSAVEPGRKIAIASASCNGLKRGSIPRHDSSGSIHEKSYRLQQYKFNDQPGQFESRLTSSRDNPQGVLRFARGIDPHGGRHRCSSVRSVKSNPTMDDHQHQYHPPAASWASIVFADGNGQSHVRAFPDSVSIRSLASIGMGSSDGRKLTIRRVPTSPSELLNMVHPPPSFEDDLSVCTSFDDADAEDPGDYRQPRRPHWANKVQFVLACISYSVGLGNVWRFPYLCYKSGGGVFLIPYFLILFVCGVPLLYMELSIGQFTRRGPIGALGQICPLFKGAGLSSVVISFLMSTYHNVIIAYAIYYFFAAFRAKQPWSDCDNSWNTLGCWLPTYSITDNRTRPNASRTPSEEFFDNKVLQISKGIEESGALRWELVACLITAWILVYFSVWKSIKSSAQVRYITATLPFILIVVFLARSLTLEGAEKGLQFFFHPRWELLSDAKVWINAAAQIFNSVGIAFGSMICFASYNKFHNTILVDSVAVSLINAFSSLLVGIFSFATIGNIALEQNMSVEAVLTDGPGLVFVVYPQALAKMPASQLWAVLFFFMLVCLSLNSQFAIVEVVVTSIQDGFPKWVKRHLVCHEMLVLLVCVISFLFGLPNITQGGIYFFQLIDHYAASISIMFLAFFEVIAISWCYGVRRLCNNVKEMTGRVPSAYFRFCWLIAAPLLIMAVWVFSLIDYEPPTYHNGEYEYPWWAEAIGWGISSLSLICIPAFAIYEFVKANGNTCAEKLRNSIKPHFEACKICGQEYCTEPIHNYEDEAIKDLPHDTSSPMQLNTSILLPKPQT
ncbi:sodium- and chloride-dependent GABA transporter ine-like isoform X1 [Hylaeus anthracinus]|uniref:sodium- and chloride-dependent GABA transporter ine-like isoform X1 n=1 Tax=Hylaeus anthracinus TaxID=313031 RepID=UPI0023B96826|nr:sodium- and chloride-dependent GABA transporter ine-like isoform X1 [Hylaeus anthracinus]